mmetsp:Transcript_114694/g.370611  ORF Transcript_114694/g.370611 Transcript_114694/m.370611 type:complete len:202 (-) Transcript_114694:1543-2148(-)
MGSCSRALLLSLEQQAMTVQSTHARHPAEAASSAVMGTLSPETVAADLWPGKAEPAVVVMKPWSATTTTTPPVDVDVPAEPSSSVWAGKVPVEPSAEDELLWVVAESSWLGRLPVAPLDDSAVAEGEDRSLAASLDVAIFALWEAVRVGCFAGAEGRLWRTVAVPCRLVVVTNGSIETGAVLCSAATPVDGLASGSAAKWP